MVSPVPKHIITEDDVRRVPKKWREHVSDLEPDPALGVKFEGRAVHSAKYAPGLATELVRLAGSKSLGDPMAGTGTIARETGRCVALNELDERMRPFLQPFANRGCKVTIGPATSIKWKREVAIFSPPYYPKADRKKPRPAHNDSKRPGGGGFRDNYGYSHPKAIGNPSGSDAIAHYRAQMTEVYAHLTRVSEKMIVVTKNWTRLGVELRLDIDTILMAQLVGWRIVGRHGWTPRPSLWQRFNAQRGTVSVTVEDILVFERTTR